MGDFPSQTFPVGPKADLPAPEESSSEQEIALCFEDAQKELEASVVKAMQLLSQKASPEGQISECKVKIKPVTLCVGKWQWLWDCYHWKIGVDLHLPPCNVTI